MYGGRGQEEGDHSLQKPFLLCRNCNHVIAAGQCIHPNGTKYKSHPVPKVSFRSAREMIRKWPVLNKLQLGHDTEDPLPHVLPGLHDMVKNLHLPFFLLLKKWMFPTTDYEVYPSFPIG